MRPDPVKLFFTILFAATVTAQASLLSGGGIGGFDFDGAPLASPVFTNDSRVVVGQFDEFGVFTAQGVATSDYFSGMVYSVSTNDFRVVDGVLYASGNGVEAGSYQSFTTNLTAFFNANHSYFTTNSRLVVASVPSYFKATMVGPWADAPPLTPATLPTIELSTNGGSTWFRAEQTTVPAVVSIYKGDSLAGGLTNLTVFSYINPNAVGSTNDYRQQTTLVTQTSAGESAVNVTGAHVIGATEAAKWANYSAVASVNLAGKDLVASVDWLFSFTNSQMRLKYRGADMLTLTGPVTTNDPPVMLTISKAGTNLTLTVQALSTPTVQYRTNLSAGAWATLPGQSAVESGGAWTVTAPVPNVTATEMFFRAYVTGGQASPGIVTLGGALKITATARPAITGSDGVLWNSNKVLFWVTATTTNKLAP